MTSRKVRCRGRELDRVGQGGYKPCCLVRSQQLLPSLLAHFYILLYTPPPNSPEHQWRSGKHQKSFSGQPHPWSSCLPPSTRPGTSTDGTSGFTSCKWGGIGSPGAARCPESARVKPSFSVAGALSPVRATHSVRALAQLGHNLVLLEDLPVDVLLRRCHGTTRYCARVSHAYS